MSEAYSPVRRVVLVGMMGAGKTAVGERLARRTGWLHLDFDREIERRAGRSIAEIFRAEGEPAFRALEADLTAEAVALHGAVLSPGGGWAAQPGLWERIASGTLFVWLRASVESLRARLAADRTRPLLNAADPIEVLGRLSREREAAYRRADAVVATDGLDPDQVAARVQSLLRDRSAVPPIRTRSSP